MGRDNSIAVCVYSDDRTADSSIPVLAASLDDGFWRAYLLPALFHHIAAVKTEIAPYTNCAKLRGVELGDIFDQFHYSVIFLASI